jgi:hypothetical protein
MKKQAAGGQVAENAFAKKALESLKQIEEEAARQKAEQLDGLREALGNIDGRIGELRHQQRQIEHAIASITGKAPAGRRPRSDHSELRARVLRWLSGHAGHSYTASELQREFPELEEVTSVAMFLKVGAGGEGQSRQKRWKSQHQVFGRCVGRLAAKRILLPEASAASPACWSLLDPSSR